MAKPLTCAGLSLLVGAALYGDHHCNLTPNDTDSEGLEPDRKDHPCAGANHVNLFFFLQFDVQGKLWNQ